MTFWVPRQRARHAITKQKERVIVPRVPSQNLALNSRWLGMFGSVGGANFTAPDDWLLSFFPPTDAIAEIEVAPGNNGCQFITTANRGFLEQQNAGSSIFDGKIVNFSCFYDAITSSTVPAFRINNVGGTQLRAPIVPTAPGRFDLVFRLSDQPFQLQIGGGVSGNDTQDISLSRPQLTLGANLLPYQPTQRILPELQFAGDTFITLPDSSVIVDNALASMSYTCRLDEYVTSNRYIWAEDGGNSYGSFRVTTLDFRGFHSNSGVNFDQLTPLTEGVEFDVVEQWGPVGTLTLSIKTLGTQSLAANVATPNAGPWSIGQRLLTGTSQWIGMIKNLRLNDDAGVVIHHWPINDNVKDGGIIRDIVGGQHGQLTLGAGVWK